MLAQNTQHPTDGIHLGRARLFQHVDPELAVPHSQDPGLGVLPDEMSQPDWRPIIRVMCGRQMYGELVIPLLN
ncbi:hypothetical protein D3C86_1826260 [compost metagenome]